MTSNASKKDLPLIALNGKSLLSLSIISSMVYGQVAWASDIQVDANSSAKHYHNHYGADQINIAKPNVQGLSHNQFYRYNVDNKGVVLNNSVTSGTAELGINVNGNRTLGGQTADIILNEVTGRGYSQLNGKQEIFGQKADYILANPNGISCNGCGFINTSKTTLLVGGVEVEDGRVSNMKADGSDALLIDNGGLNTDSALDLIAPTIQSKGDIKAGGDLNVIIGRNNVDAQGKATAADAERSQVFDSNLLGGMHAGRIQVVSTNNGVGVNLSGDIAAIAGEVGGDINAEVNGTVRLLAAKVGAKEFTVNAKNVAVVGTTKESLSKFEQQSDFWKRLAGWNNKLVEEKRDQAFEATEINARDVALNAVEKADINAAVINAKNIVVKAKDVALSTTTTKSTVNKDDVRARYFWRNGVKVEKTNEQLHVNKWNAGKSVQITAKDGTLEVNAADISAKKVKLAGKNVQVKGAAVSNSSNMLNDYRNEGNKLKNGKIVDNQRTETYTASKIKATDDIVMTADANVHVHGSQLNAKTVDLNAGNTVLVDNATTTNTKTEANEMTYIGGSKSHSERRETLTQHGSNIDADNVVINGKQGVKIAASKITGAKQVDLNAENGEVALSSALNSTVVVTKDKPDSSSIERLTSSVKHENSEQTAVNTEIKSGKDVNIKARDIALGAANINATNNIGLNASGKITSDVVNATKTALKEDFTLGFTGYTKGDGKKLQGEVGGGLQGVTHATGTQTSVASNNALNAKQITINADSIDLKGSDVNASAGNIDIDANNINLGAGAKVAKTSIDHKGVTGALVYAKAGLNSIELGSRIGHSQTNVDVITSDAVATKLTSAKDININAKQALNQYGVALKGADINLNAADINTAAARNTVTTNTVHSKGGVSLKGSASTDFTSATVGIGAKAHGEGFGISKVESTAVVSKLEANNVRVTGKNVKDQGTHYVAKNVDINADTYKGEAASNSVVSTKHTGQAALGLDVSTSDFQSVNLSAGLESKYQYDQQGESQAVLGSIEADKIRINAKDSIESSMNMAANENIDLTAVNRVALTQANDRKWHKAGGYAGGLTIGATYVPAANAATPSFGINGAINYLDEQYAKAVVATLTGKNLNMKATNTDNGVATAQGANVHVNNDFNMTANNVEFNHAQDVYSVLGVDLSGKVSLSLSVKGNSVGGGSGGISGDIGNINEKRVTAHGGNIIAKNIVMQANSDDALVVSGANMTANTIELSNAGGSVDVRAAKSTSYKGSWGLGAEFSAGGKKGNPINKMTVGGHLDVDTDNSESYTNGNINADSITITSADDLRLQSNIATQKLVAKAKGDVTLSSALNKTNIFKFGVGAKLGGKPVIFGKDTKPKDILDAATNDFNNGTFFGLKGGGRINFLVDVERETVSSNIDAASLDITSGSGKVTIDAANVSSDNGNFNGAEVTEQSQKNYVHKIGFGASGKTPNLKEMLTDLLSGKKVESPIKFSKEFEWKDSVVDSSVSVK